MKDSEKLDDGLVISSVGNSGLIVPGHTEWPNTRFVKRRRTSLSWSSTVYSLSHNCNTH